jgi:membrane protein DedA with SNARE-associated domain
VLYLALAAAAAVENVFPPLPADTVVAFGSFLAARGRANFPAAFAAAWIGNIAGAMLTYALGRRAGAAWWGMGGLRFGRPDAARRLHGFYERRGLLALAVSRFLPGIRALVPPFAGALRVPAGRFVAIIAVASGLWYGILTYAGYRLAANWATVETLVASFTRGAGIASAVLVVGILGAWYLVWRSRRERHDRDDAEQP